MKFIKKNIKLIAVILIGMLLVSGISVYATYTYFSTDVSYIKDGTEISVAQALDELYEIKKDYIKPQGEKKIDISANGSYTEDISQYANAVINVAVNNWNYVELDIPKNGSDVVYNCGYKPELIYGYIQPPNSTDKFIYVVMRESGKAYGFDKSGNALDWSSMNYLTSTGYTFKTQEAAAAGGKLYLWIKK